MGVLWWAVFSSQATPDKVSQTQHMRSQELNATMLTPGKSYYLYYQLMSFLLRGQACILLASPQRAFLYFGDGIIQVNLFDDSEF